MKNLTLILPIVILSTYVFAGNNVDQFYDISSAYKNKIRTFGCKIIREEIKELSLKTENEINNDLSNVAREIELSINTEQSSEIKKDLMLYLDSINSMKREKKSKKFIIKSLESLCKVVRFPIQNVAKGVSIINTSVFNTVTFPFTSLFNFFRGATSNREKDSLGKRNSTLFRVLGPKKGVPSYLFSSVIWTVPDILLKFNPVTLGINASIMVELITNYQCFHLNKLDTKKARFCKTYNDIKEFFHKGNSKAFRLGKKFQAYLDKKIILKRSKIQTHEFCSYKPRKQVRRAKKALERRNFFKDNEFISKTQIILPIHKNNCTKILVVAKSEKFLKTIKEQIGSSIEGVEMYVTLSSDDLSKFYFTKDEIDKKPLTENICHEVEKNHLLKAVSNKMDLYGNFFKSSMSPEMLGRPIINESIAKDSDVVKGNVTNLKNLIFSIGPVHSDEKEISKRLDELARIVKSVKKDYKRINKQKNFKSCMSIIKRKDIDVNSLTTKFEKIIEINSNRDVKNYKELSAIRHFIKKKRKRLKLKWEVIPTNNIDDVIAASKSRDVGNIIVISHGKRSGFLVDSSGDEIPKSAFAELSPSLMSLNFYSCYSQKLIEKYSFVKKFKALQSFYKVRFLTNVEENNFMDSSYFAPISAFGTYLVDLDKHLYYARKGAIALQKVMSKELGDFNYEKRCLLEIEDLIVESGKYSVSLNNQLVGSISELNDIRSMNFPCSFLKEGKNSLSIKNMINQGGSKIKNLESFKLNLEGQELTQENALLKLNSFIKVNFNSI